MAVDIEPKMPPTVEGTKIEDSSCTSGSKTPSTPSPKHRPPPIETDKADVSRWSAGSETPLETPYENPRSPPSFPPTLTKTRPKSWTWHFLTLFLSLLWLPFIITLLVLNFTSHAIGASAWCPFGRCTSNAFNSQAIATAVRLDKQDHDVEAGLQYVAQAFEIWFFIIASSLLYEVGMLIARSSQGLPVGFMLTHLEFENAKNLINPLLWTSAFSSKHASHEERKRRSVIGLFLFALLAALLTILVNLMGAATAVLLIPRLSWVETDKVPQQRFDSMALAQGPIGDSAFAQMCTSSQLLAGNYSCTTSIYGPSLDEWATTAQASVKQFPQTNGTPLLGTSQEAAVQFALNVSNDQGLIWIANRQVLRDVSGDYFEATGQEQNRSSADGDTEEDSPDPRFSTSLQTVLQRTGPAVGVQPSCFVGNVSVVTVATGKEIHCYSNWQLNEGSNYTKCFRIGFNPSEAYSTFNIASPKSTTPTSITSSFSDHATFYNTTTDFSSGILPCLSNASAPTCDWDRIFSTPLPSSLQNTSTNVGVISYSIPSAPSSQARVWCEALTYLSFPTYSMDTSPSSNSLSLVQLNNLDSISISTSTNTNPSPLVVNPNWFLAAWSTDRNGTVDGTRPIAQELPEVLSAFWNEQSAPNALQFLLYHIYALGQAMSMVNYNTTPPSSPPNEIDPAHPVFATWARLRVWAWGLHARTSHFGAVIAIAGCVAVVARIMLGLFVARRHYSAAELYVAALEHRSAASFEGMRRQRDMARVKFGIRDGSGVDGRVGFVNERGGGGVGRYA